MSEIKKKIYLVEDDPAIIDIYLTMMQKAGYDVQSLTLGEEVIRKIKSIAGGEEVPPDLILLDLILPDMNGVDVLREIRKNEATKGLAVFILTNQEEASSSVSEDAKPDKFIIKANITPTQLLDTIKKQLT